MRGNLRAPAAAGSCGLPLSCWGVGRSSVLLPASPLRFQAVGHPVFKHLAARRTLWVATIVLGLFVVLKSNTLYILIFRIWGG